MTVGKLILLTFDLNVRLVHAADAIKSVDDFNPWACHSHPNAYVRLTNNSWVGAITALCIMQFQHPYTISSRLSVCRSILVNTELVFSFEMWRSEHVDFFNRQCKLN